MRRGVTRLVPASAASQTPRMNLHANPVPRPAPWQEWPAAVPRPRDYLQTIDGLWLAVVSSVVDEGHAITSLRYRRDGVQLRKLGTAEAGAWLRAARPDYLVRSPLVDAVVHRVPPADVVQVHRPDQRLLQLEASSANDQLEAVALQAVHALGAAGADTRRMGVGGSLLLGAHGPGSDIDLVVYGRAAFHAARRALGVAIASGTLAPPGDAAWREAWERRGTDLSLEEYIEAERRKLNKAVLQRTRIDLSLVADFAEEVPEHGPYRKEGMLQVRAEVLDASAAFDHPARYGVRHPDVAEVVSYTPTFAGQAREGEVIDARGWLEVDSRGARRLLVGTSREAGGEWIRARSR